MPEYSDKEYIKLNRKILNWGWYSNPCARDLFIHCLLKANWKDGVWQGTEYKRGEFITSLPSLSRELGFSIQQIRTAINHLKSTGELTDRSFNKFRVITVVKYDEYQSYNRQGNSQATDSQQAGNRQLTADKEYKEGKNKKREEEKDIAAPSGAPAPIPLVGIGSFEMQCVEHLIASCLATFPKSKVPDTVEKKRKWAAEIEKMKRLDKISEDEIKQALWFATHDDFWKANIRSAKKFREKFETLYVQGKRSRGLASSNSLYETADRLEQLGEKIGGERF